MVLVCLAAASGTLAADADLPRETLPDNSHFAAWPIRMYQRYISRMDGHQCPMTPSCSQYSVEAFRKHGYLLGWIMTSDRLLRCGRDETRLSPTRRKNGEPFSYDPLKNNDFWWFDERR
jgi:putative membrane protein insertion efficiency factor